MVCVEKTKTDDSSTLVEEIDVPTRCLPRDIVTSFVYKHDVNVVSNVAFICRFVTISTSEY